MNEKKLATVIREHFGLSDTTVIKPELSFGELGADSLDMVELVMAVEDEFSIEIPDEDCERITTVGELLDVVDRLDVRRAVEEGAR